MLDTAIINKLQVAKQILVAYSGGLDSTVLLHLLISSPKLKNKKIIAIHVNHQLSKNALQWQQHCEKICKELDIKLIAKKVKLEKKHGESIEDLARHARYEVFAALMKKGDVLVTAHHQNDQAETLLLQLFRGAGIKGLAAMPANKPFASGTLVRPLLHLPRKTLEQYAKKHHLTWVEDESNLDCHYSRNYIRHKIMPLIEASWPNALANIARSAEHHAQAEKILALQAASDLVNVQTQIDQLNIRELRKLSAAQQNNLLRYWITRNQQPLPSEAVLQQIVEQGVNAKIDAEPCIAWANTEVRRYHDNLYIMEKLTDFDTSHIIPWKNQYPILDLDLKKLKGKLTIRFRQGGERFHPKGRTKSQTLKKLMQEWNIPTWQRDRVPLLFTGEELIAVIGYATAAKILD